jgi:very-short-patch-repair endonuclease
MGCKGFKWIHKNNDMKRVSPDILNLYLDNEWEIGYSDEYRKNMSESTSGEKNGMYGTHRFGKDNPMYGIHRYGENAPMYGKHHTEESNMKNSLAKKGKKLEQILKNPEKAEEVRNNLSKSCHFNTFKDKTWKEIYGIEKAEELSKNRSEFLLNKTYEEIFKNEKSVISKKKQQRLLIIDMLKNNNNIGMSYNKGSCMFFKDFEEKYNLPKGRFAMFGSGEFLIKELGYLLDYFNEDLKLIIEWDENHHFDIKGNLKEKDILREREIRNLFTNYIFIRIKEKDFLISKNPKVIDYNKCSEYILENYQLNKNLKEVMYEIN